MAEFRCCALVPTYDNPATLRRVVEGIRAHIDTVIVVDDGSHGEGRALCRALHDEGLALLVRRERNGGKGAAVKAGFARAGELGFTHAFQIDADGQHELSRIPAFLQEAQRRPQAAVFAYPEYDESAPKGRLWARKITRFWVNLELGRAQQVQDAMVGFRVYPLAAVEKLRIPSNRMDFDVEIAVRLVWAGTPVTNLPVGVRYLSAAQGGRSHFQPFRDNLRLAWLHSRLCTLGASRWCLRRLHLPPLLGSS